MTMATEIKNARIESTMLGYEDHGILTAFVTVGGDGWGCGFGGYGLDQWSEGRRSGSARPTAASSSWKSFASSVWIRGRN